jgi:hypothetical protein
MIGRGTGSCKEWTEARKAPDSIESNLNQQWVLGFLSALANYTTGDLLAETTADAIWKAMDRHCELEPLDIIRNAALKVARQLKQ